MFKARFKTFLSNHANLLMFGGIGLFFMVNYQLQPTPSNVTSYTDHFLYGLPMLLGPFLIMVGLVLDMLQRMF